MLAARTSYWSCTVLLLALLAGCTDKSNDENVETASPEEVNLKKGAPPKPKKGSTKSDKLAKAIATHVKNLKDPDPEVRQNSAEMLGILNATTAVGDLIEVLNPERSERINVLLAAHGALAKITGKNFGYKAYAEWQSWWKNNKEEFLKKAETGVDDLARIRAETSNTVGLELMRSGELRGAQTQFLDAVNSDPQNPMYHNNCGLCLLKQGRYLDAMEYFDESIGLNPDLPQPYMNIGRCYSMLDKSIEAQAWYKKAQAHDKDGKLWDNFWMIGVEYMKRNEWRMAYEYLDQARVKAEKQHIRDPRLYKDLAITHYGLDEYHSAWKELMNVRQLGFEPDPGFVAKVRKALVDRGVDPDAEDKAAREALAGRPLPDTRDLPSDMPQKP